LSSRCGRATPSSSQGRDDALADEVTLELDPGGKDVEDELAARSGGATLITDMGSGRVLVLRRDLVGQCPWRFGVMENDRRSAWSLVIRVRENVHSWPRGGQPDVVHLEGAF
jgi:hypothetical protein